MTERMLPSIRAARLERRISQGTLARLAGISRQSYAAIESGASVPATDVALRLARALGTQVETLFRLPDEREPAAEVESAGLLPPTGSRVRLAKVGGRLRSYPLRGGGWRGVEPADGWGVPREGGGVAVDLLAKRPPVSDLVAVGCDPAFSLVVETLRRERGTEVYWHHQTSRGALEMLAAGEAHVAGVHLVDPETGLYNEPWVRLLVPFACTRVGFAVWTQEIVVPAANPRGIRGVSDLAQPGLRFLNREPGSGTRMLLDDRIQHAGLPPDAIPGYLDTAARSHLGVAEAVATGLADAGVGIGAATRAFGLTGIPLGEEQYDLVIPNHFLDLPAIQHLLDLLGSRSLGSQVESLGGYDTGPMGQPR
jgi:putative molybdopterin biosynthesis protein